MLPQTAKQLAMVFLATGIIATSCNKDDDHAAHPHDENESEVITTLKVQLTDSANQSSSITFQFRDKDGAGGNGPDIFDTIRLQAGKTYIADILLLDESGSEIKNIHDEVRSESNDHLLIISPQNLSMNAVIVDRDVNGLPLGLKSHWRCSNASSGNLRITLKHQPESKDGTEAPGETDVEVNFPAIIN